MTFIRLAALLVASAFAACQAHAQQPSLPRNENVLVDYQQPVDPLLMNESPDDPDRYVRARFAVYPELKRVYARMRERKVLERYAQFLVPLRLPSTLRLIGRHCGQVNAFFSAHEQAIIICYEYVLAMEQAYDRERELAQRLDVSWEDAIVGGIVSVLLHETGHAVFYLYNIPVLGREEDAADRVAAYVALQFGDKVASTVIKGSLWKWRAFPVFSWNAPTASLQRALYADEHSSNRIRFQTFLCIAHGAKPTLFQTYMTPSNIPPSRAAGCKREYEQVDLAFKKTLLPMIDRDLMAKVQSATWFFPQDVGTMPVQTR